MFEEKINAVKINLVESIKQHITEKYNFCGRNNFIWSFLQLRESFFILRKLYINAFKNEFKEYITSEIEFNIECAYLNCLYVIDTYIETQTNWTIDELLNFVNLFIEKQILNIGEWNYALIEIIPNK